MLGVSAARDPMPPSEASSRRRGVNRFSHSRLYNQKVLERPKGEQQQVARNDDGGRSRSRDCVQDQRLQKGRVTRSNERTDITGNPENFANLADAVDQATPRNIAVNTGIHIPTTDDGAQENRPRRVCE